MSTMLSTISRQLEPSITIVFQTQSPYTSVPTPGISGMSTSGDGGLPSGSFQTNNWPFFSMVVHTLVRALGGTRFAYGMPTHRPSPDQRQSWNGQATSLPL